jgi:DNA-binding response OmpR family regulator
MHDHEAASRGRVLVVEDAEPIRTLLSILLGRRGYEVVAVADGRAALDAAGRGFDLVLLDVGLPDINGLEVCRRLRSRAATADLTIIMLTGRDHPGDIRDGLAAGADDFLTKPFEESELMARLFSASLASLRRPGLTLPHRSLEGRR